MYQYSDYNRKRAVITYGRGQSANIHHLRRVIGDADGERFYKLHLESGYRPEHNHRKHGSIVSSGRYDCLYGYRRSRHLHGGCTGKHHGGRFAISDLNANYQQYLRGNIRHSQRFGSQFLHLVANGCYHYRKHGDAEPSCCHDLYGYRDCRYLHFVCYRNHQCDSQPYPEHCIQHNDMCR